MIINPTYDPRSIDVSLYDQVLMLMAEPRVVPVWEIMTALQTPVCAYVEQLIQGFAIASEGSELTSEEIIAAMNDVKFV